MKTITKATKSLTLTINNAPGGVPILKLRRIGGTINIPAQHLATSGSDYTFSITPKILKPGRYYAFANFGSCCCLKDEVFVDTSCGLENISTTSTPKGCGTC